MPKKAIITAAGSGTRFLPATKAQPKEMLPIIDKPIIQYSVEELADSGVKDIIIVTKQTGHITENHFDDHFELEDQLEKTGKTKFLAEVRKSAELANFIFLRQKSSMPYGNGTPLKISADIVSDGPFFYLFGDDITRAKVPVCKQLALALEQNPDAAAVIGVREIPQEETSKYGIVKIKEGTTNEVETFVEKPKVDEAPSNLAACGRYLFTPKILPIIESLAVGKDNELWLTDAIIELAKSEKVIFHKIEGDWFTTGDPLNFLKASVEFAFDREDLKKDFEEYLRDFLGKK
ncbi:NTP transferase domain-containing protein [Candidatus Nomurabacteria bacterium]|nr:NTP transferase domain-containing protein [Candidatus Nomurabacteria bacterium]